MNVSMKQTISTEQAPRAIGPYSQAVIHSGLVFLSGQIPLDPSTGQVVGDDIAQQTRRVLDNIRAVLEAAGTSLPAVLRTTVFLKDMAEFPAMNSVYAEYFNENPPARSTVEVARLPRDVRVEIDAIAALEK
jgi:2-iminobutanoate/2-iminopropanoate deaminase